MTHSSGPFTYHTTVEFADTDMVGIMHFSNYFRLMERAEHAFWRSLDLSVMLERDGRTVSWPRVQATCDYKMPLRFEDAVEIGVTVLELRSKSVRFGFVFKKSGCDAAVAEGAITAVYAAFDEAVGRMRAVEIPPDIAEKLRPAIAS